MIAKPSRKTLRIKLSLPLVSNKRKTRLSISYIDNNTSEVHGFAIDYYDPGDVATAPGQQNTITCPGLFQVKTKGKIEAWHVEAQVCCLLDVPQPDPDRKPRVEDAPQLSLSSFLPDLGWQLRTILV